MRVVFDANVFVSAFVVPGSQGERAFRLAQERHVDLVSSVAILTETAGILRVKFSQPDENVTAVLKLISRSAEIVKPTVRLAVVQHEADNRILECAVAGGADLVVTGDRHLLGLRRHGDATIVRLSDFLRLFPQPAGRMGGMRRVSAPSSPRPRPPAPAGRAPRR
jgi:putative PIN family toxin of toxin-antitoxin system